MFATTFESDVKSETPTELEKNVAIIYLADGT
jgi:hypothetical protein